MARGRARIEWQKEGGGGGGRHVGGMLKSRGGSLAREQKAEMIDASETAPCLSRDIRSFPFFSPLLFFTRRKPLLDFFFLFLNLMISTKFLLILRHGVLDIKPFSHFHLYRIYLRDIMLLLRSRFTFTRFRHIKENRMKFLSIGAFSM